MRHSRQKDDGTEKDKAEAISLLEQASGLGHAEASFNLAWLQLYDREIEAPVDKTAELLINAVKNGRPELFDRLSQEVANFDGKMIASLQQHLAELGYYKGPIDGDFGAGSLRALSQLAN